MFGILAGMGPRSTAPFIDSVVDMCKELYGANYDEDFPEMMILSLPTPFYIDKPMDHNKMKAVIIGGLKKLENTGVDFIAMPCNSSHAYYDELASAINVPLLNIIDETLKELSGSGKTTLLCTRMTMNTGLYQKGFEKENIEFDFFEEWQNKIDELIINIKSGSIEEKAVPIWRELINDLEKKEIKQAVLACTDINVVLPYVDTSINLVDSSEALAKAVVNKYLSSLNKQD